MCITTRDIHSCHHSGAIFSISRCPPYLFIESLVKTTTGPWLTNPDCEVAARGDETTPGTGSSTGHQVITGAGVRTDTTSDSASRADKLLEILLQDESSVAFEEKQKCELRTLMLFRRVDCFCRDCVMKQRFNEEDGAIGCGNDDGEYQKNEEYQNGHDPELDREFETATSGEEGDDEQHVIAAGKSLQDIHLSSDSEHEYAIFQSEDENSDCSDEFLEMKIHKKGFITSCAAKSEGRMQVFGTSSGDEGDSESDAGSVLEMKQVRKGSNVNATRGQLQEDNQTVEKIKGFINRVERIEKRNTRRIRDALRNLVGAEKVNQVGIDDGDVIGFVDENRQDE